jgi:hypothetical protein
MPLRHGINAKALSRLYPFHIMFDKECNIVQTGHVLQKIIPMEAGEPMSQFFSIKEPERLNFCFKTIFGHRKISAFTLEHNYDSNTRLLLHGEVHSKASKKKEALPLIT